MIILDIQSICKALKGNTTDIKWEDHLCFNVGAKMYLISSPDSLPVTASFKTTEEDFAELCEREGISPARYLARYKWVQLDDISLLTYEEWENYIRHSYKLVFSKLPARLRKEITA